MCELEGTLTGGDGAGKDDLGAGVEIGGDEAIALSSLVAERRGAGFVGAEDREHGGRLGFCGGLHEAAAGFDEGHAVFKGEDAGDVQGGVFAQGESGGVIRGGGFAEFQEGFVNGDGSDEDGKLGDIGFVEGLLGAVEAEFA